jgi:Reverse transcriptase (RNA-dependent DNA polymerase).
MDETTGANDTVQVRYADSEHEPIEPRNIHEAMKSRHWPEWLTAIHEELGSLEAMNVYEEVENLPPGKKAVGSKWVLHLKRDEFGSVTRFKARLVAQGFTQIPGQDFTHTFAPVARWESIRFVICVAAILDWELRHIDIKTAYLNGKLNEEIYLKRPEILGPGYWRLLRALYGLRQSGREWYLDIHNQYLKMGMTRCEADWSVHHRTRSTGRSMTTTSVDDITLASSSVVEADGFTAEIKAKYTITDNGDVSWLLGCKITRWRTRRAIKIDQERYTIAILEQFGMANCNSVTVPMAGQLTSDMSPKTEAEERETAKLPYKELVGKVMYLATCTRPDIAFTVRELARFMSNYGEKHWAAAKHLLRYLQGTRSIGIIYGNIDKAYPIFRMYTDSDWAQGESRKSVCGYIAEMGGGPIAWSSKQQAVIALSTTEAEYIATTHGAKEGIWLRSLADELKFPQPKPSPMLCDSEGAITCTRDPQHHSRMKHIDIRYHFIRDCVQKGIIEVIHIPGIDNVADLLTKPLTRVIHEKWLERLRMDRGQGRVSTSL